MTSKRVFTFHPNASALLNIDATLLHEIISKTLLLHAENVIRGQSLLKNSHESAVSIVKIDGRTLCVKEFKMRSMGHAMKGILRPTQAVRSYRNGLLLNSAGIKAANPLALVREVQFGIAQCEWLVMEGPDGAIELDRYILTQDNAGWDYAERTEFTINFAEFIATLHRQSIFHSDLKSCNIMVNYKENQLGFSEMFSLIDYDDVKVFGKLPDKMRIKNLAQLFLSIPTSIGAKLRLRFLHHYCKSSGLGREQYRDLLFRIMRQCSGTRILYVGLQGDIVEQWSAPNMKNQKL